MNNLVAFLFLKISINCLWKCSIVLILNISNQGYLCLSPSIGCLSSNLYIYLSFFMSPSFSIYLCKKVRLLKFQTKQKIITGQLHESSKQKFKKNVFKGTSGEVKTQNLKKARILHFCQKKSKIVALQQFFSIYYVCPITSWQRGGYICFSQGDQKERAGLTKKRLESVDWGKEFALQTRMTTFIKTKFKISDDQTNIAKYELAANITVYHIISKLILQQIIITNCSGPVNHLR